MANITPTVAAAFIPEVWAEAITSYLKVGTPVLNSVLDYSFLVGSNAKATDTIHIPEFGAISVEEKVPGTAYTAYANSNTDISLSLDQQWGRYIVVEDIAEIQSNVNLLDIYARETAYAIMQKVAATVSTTIQSASGNDITLANDNTMTDAEWREGMAALGDAGVRDYTETFGGGNPTIISSMLGVDAFNDYDKTGLPKGAMIAPYGIATFQSSDWGSTGASGEEAASLWHRSAVAFAIQLIPKIVVAPDPANAGVGISVTAIWGTKLLADDRIVNFNQKA